MQDLWHLIFSFVFSQFTLFLEKILSMTTAVLEVPTGQDVKKTEIPEYLIYEMYMGQPIYYRGYKEVIFGKKTFEQIMGDSSLQSWLKTRLGYFLLPLLEEKGFEIFAGELGISYEKEGSRAADIAIYKAGMELTRHYAQFSPEIVIEIDVQADTKDLGGDMKYIKTKTNQYLSHGTKKVIWIFTNASAVMESTKQKKFQIDSWDKDIEVMEGVKFNIVQILEARRQKQ
jgi:Putative restriction endonuclease